MQVIALIVSILAIIGMFFGFSPFLGWMNWGVIPVAIIGLILSIIALATSKKGKGMAIAGGLLFGVGAVGFTWTFFF